MANIAVGSELVIDDGSAQETVTVTAITPTTFSATATNSHDGTAAPFAIVSRSYPRLGQGWLNYLAAQGPAGPAPAGEPDRRADRAAGLPGMKQALSPADERLLAVLQDPAATLPSRPAARCSA